MHGVKVKKPLCIGLTGGIGSGKTTVAKLFEKLGVPVIDADVIAHQITQVNGVAYPLILDHFGKAILNADQSIDRRKLRTLIFENATEKKWLEALLHPLIRQTIKDWISTVNAPYCICVIPLLAESTGIDFIDRVLLIDTPVAMQIARAKERDQATEESIQKIIDSQASQQKRISIADDIIVNESDIEALEIKIRKLDTVYTHLLTP